MKVELTNFFLHPLHKSHAPVTKVLSVITLVALSALSFGFYLIAFAVGHICERHEVKQVKPPQLDPICEQLEVTQIKLPQPLSERLVHIKEKQADHLGKLEAMVAKGKYFWKHLQAHTVHENSGFDWWMFPVDRPSASHGPKYVVNLEEIERLKLDPEFMANYRKGVVLVAKSWGWDLEKNVDVTNEFQFWAGYDVRLGKMLQSLKLFGQDDLRTNLVGFIDKHELRKGLESWIHPYLQ